MQYTKHIWNIIFAICIVGGGILGYTVQKQRQSAAIAKQSNEELSIKTDALSLQIFQNAIQMQNGNVLVAPAIICESLQALQSIAGGKTKDELAALRIQQPALNEATATSCSLIAVDINIPKVNNEHTVIALPFSENFPLALSMFNSSLATYTPFPNMQLATSDLASTRTRLIAGSVAYYSPRWRVPFHKANSQTADFDNASGRVPKFTQMRARGFYRHVQSESWEAIELPIKSESSMSPPLVFVAISPRNSARDFAASLTPEKLSDIRTALAEATPSDSFVAIPRFEIEVSPQDFRPALRQLGLNSLFSDDEADFSLLTKEKIHLNAMVHASGIKLRESADSAPEDGTLEQAPRHVKLTRPFIWFIGDAKSTSPMNFMGLIEEM